MDELLLFVAQLVLHWRVGLTVLLGLLLAFLLVIAIPAFTGGYGVTLVILAFGAGLIWEGTSSPSHKVK